MGRKRTLPEDAEQIAVYLTPDQQLFLEVIRLRRKKRGEGRISTSEIVVDGLLRILADVEKLTAGEVEALLKVSPPERSNRRPNLTVFPKS